MALSKWHLARASVAIPGEHVAMHHGARKKLALYLKQLAGNLQDLASARQKNWTLSCSIKGTSRLSHTQSPANNMILNIKSCQ